MLRVVAFLCWEPEIINHFDYSIFHLQAQWQGLNDLSEFKNETLGCKEYGEIIEVWMESSKIYFRVLYSHQELEIYLIARDRKSLIGALKKGLNGLK